MQLDNPKTSTAEVLHHLITHGEVSIMNFPWLSGFRTRISEFYTKHGIFIEKKRETRKNRYNNTYSYVIHTLPKREKNKAVKLYKKLNKN